MISATFIFQGKLYIVLHDGTILRIEDQGMEGVVNWKFEYVANLRR